jgi:hypothetical protein
LLSRVGPCADGVGARPLWLIGSRTALAPVIVPLAGFPLHRNVLRNASVTVPLSGLPLHRNALRRLLIAGLGIHAELLV